MNLDQYTKVFQCDMSTFIYTNKLNQYYDVTKHNFLGVSILMLSQKYTPMYEKGWKIPKNAPMETAWSNTFS